MHKRPSHTPRHDSLWHLMPLGAVSHRWQMITAWGLLAYTPLFIAIWLWQPWQNAQDFQLWLAQPINLLLHGLGWLMIWIHGYIGIRDVIIDYVPRAYLPMAMRSFNLLWLCQLACLFAIAILLILA